MTGGREFDLQYDRYSKWLLSDALDSNMSALPPFDDTAPDSTAIDLSPQENVGICVEFQVQAPGFAIER